MNVEDSRKMIRVKTNQSKNGMEVLVFLINGKENFDLTELEPKTYGYRTSTLPCKLSSPWLAFQISQPHLSLSGYGH